MGASSPARCRLPPRPLLAPLRPLWRRTPCCRYPVTLCRLTAPRNGSARGKAARAVPGVCLCVRRFDNAEPSARGRAGHVLNLETHIDEHDVQGFSSALSSSLRASSLGSVPCSQPSVASDTFLLPAPDSFLSLEAGKANENKAGPKEIFIY